MASINETSGNQERADRAREIGHAILNWPIRPYYTPEELVMMLPEIAVMLGYVGRGFNGNIAGKISRELRKSRVPYLLNKDHPEGFLYKGMRQQFLVVANHDEYEKPISQEDFDRMLPEWKTYGELRLQSSAPSARALQIRHKKA